MISIETSQVLKGLEARRAALSADLWTAATAVASGGGADTLTQLVRLKADIEAVDFAIATAPKGGAEA